MGYILIIIGLIIMFYSLYRLSFKNENDINVNLIPTNKDEISPGNPFMVLPHQNKKYELEAVVCYEPTKETIEQYFKYKKLKSFNINIWRDHVFHSFRFSCMVSPL